MSALFQGVEFHRLDLAEKKIKKERSKLTLHVSQYRRWLQKQKELGCPPLQKVSIPEGTVLYGEPGSYWAVAAWHPGNAYLEFVTDKVSITGNQVSFQTNSGKAEGTLERDIFVARLNDCTYVGFPVEKPVPRKPSVQEASSDFTAVPL